MDEDRPDGTASFDATFGFDAGDGWLDHLKAAEGRQELGRLGAYRILEEAQKGGQGVVFRALQPETHRQVALKRLRAGRLSSDRARQRFEREIEAASSLSHPGIVTVFGVERVDGLPILAMEWIDGEPITDWVERRAPGSDAVLRLCLEVCDAIHHAHVKGVLHRDIKPSNVLVDEQGHAHVLDFGLAKFVAEEGDRPTLTEAGGFLGTPAYASPEALQGGAGVDVRSDVYSLGVLLYEMLTGSLPYQPKSHQDLARQQAAEALPLPSRRRRGLSRELDAILVKALRTAPERRYQSVEALAADLRRFLSHEPVSAHPPSSWYELRTLVRRNRAAFASGALVLVALVAFAVSISVHARQLRIARNRSAEAEQRERLAREEAEANESRAKEEWKRSEAVLGFFLDTIASSEPYSFFRRDMREADPPTVAEVLEHAAREVDEKFPDDPRAEISIRWTIGRTLRGLDRVDRAVDMLEGALAIYERCGFPGDRTMARTQLELGQSFLALGREAEGLARMEAGLELLESLGDVARPDLFLAHLDIAQANAALGRPFEQQEHAEESLRQLAELDRSGSVPYGIEGGSARSVVSSVLADALLRQGRADDAKRLFVECLERPNHPLERAGLLYALGRIELDAKEYEAAEARLGEVLDILRERLPAGHRHLYDVYFYLARAVQARGGVDELGPIALAALENHRVHRKEHAGREDKPMLRAQRRLAVQLGKANLLAAAQEVAEDAYRGASELFDEDDPTGLPFLGTNAELLCVLGRRDEAEILFATGYDRVFRASGTLSAEQVAGVTELVLIMQQWRFHELADPLQEMATELLRTTPGVPVEHALAFLLSAATRLDQRGMPERAAVLRAQAMALPAGARTLLSLDDPSAR